MYHHCLKPRGRVVCSRAKGCIHACQLPTAQNPPRPSGALRGIIIWEIRDSVKLTEFTRKHACGIDYGLLSSDRCRGQECRYPLLDSWLQWRPCSAYHKTLARNEEDEHLKNGEPRNIYPRLQLNVLFWLHLRSYDLFVHLVFANMPGGPHPPLSVIASWPAPNYINPEGRGRVTTTIAAVLSPITLFIIFARLWVRFYLQRSAGIDDWLMIAALVCLLLSHAMIHALTPIATLHCSGYSCSIQ